MRTQVAILATLLVAAGCAGEGPGDFPADDDTTPGDDDTTPECPQQPETIIDGWLDVSAGDQVTCGRYGEGTVHCWGSCYFGQCEPEVRHFRSVSVNSVHGCGIREGCEVSCWGVDDASNYDNGQVTGTPDVPMQQVTTGPDYNCGILLDNTVTCWGEPTIDYGQLEPPDELFAQLSIGAAQVCGLSTSGELLCFGGWGYPYTIPPEGTYVSMDSGYAHACAIDTRGLLACWGCDESSVDHGQCDPPGGHFVQVSAGSRHSCAIDEDGSIVCWGYNLAGQCDAPEGGFIQVSAGEIHSCAIDEENDLVCWGHCEPSEKGDVYMGECDVPHI